eukprot:scaffold2858_cov659-Pavlova_lutheri.AAC.59
MMHDDVQLSLPVLLIHKAVLCIRLNALQIGQGVDPGCHGKVLKRQDAGVMKRNAGPWPQGEALVLGELIIPSHEVGERTLERVAERHLACQRRLEEYPSRVVPVEVSNELACCFSRFVPRFQCTDLHHTGGPQVLCFQNFSFLDRRSLSHTHSTSHERGKQPSTSFRNASPTLRACTVGGRFPPFLSESPACASDAARHDLVPSTAGGLGRLDALFLPPGHVRQRCTCSDALHVGQSVPWSVLRVDVVTPLPLAPPCTPSQMSLHLIGLPVGWGRVQALLRPSSARPYPQGARDGPEDKASVRPHESGRGAAAAHGRRTFVSWRWERWNVPSIVLERLRREEIDGMDGKASRQHRQWTTPDGRRQEARVQSLHLRICSS